MTNLALFFVEITMLRDIRQWVGFWTFGPDIKIGRGVHGPAPGPGWVVNRPRPGFFHTFYPFLGKFILN